MMKSFQNLSITLIIGSVLVVPFFILEWYFTSGFPRGFPLALFNIMLVNGFLFAGMLLSALKHIREGTVQIKLASFLLKITALVLLGSAWTTIVFDQMPCFLGKSGC